MPRGTPAPKHVRCGNAKRAKGRTLAEHIFAAQEHRFRLVARAAGKVRASAKPGLASPVANRLRLDWFETRPAPA